MEKRRPWHKRSPIRRPPLPGGCLFFWVVFAVDFNIFVEVSCIFCGFLEGFPWVFTVYVFFF